jgi:dGTPase
MENFLSQQIYLQRSRFQEEDVRGAFFRDQTAIIHSMPFRRLKHKTQVFFAPENDHVCTRIEHVMHVATIATSICKGLISNGWNLNTEMAFAIGLGHDLGHAPFGHEGESILNAKLGGNNAFIHEINSYRVVEYLTNSGKGLNLTYGVKDGIICHNGEKFEQSLKPKETPNILDEIQSRKVQPSSYEACIVRFSDKIAYLGRDIEDAIIAGFIKSSDIPLKIKDKIGTSNSEIITTFVNDIIEYSKNKDVIGLSEEKHELILLLRNFNYQNIYCSDKKTSFPFAEKIINTIFDYLGDLYTKFGEDGEKYSERTHKVDRHFGRHIVEMTDFYKNEPDKRRIITDFVSGMTDLYAIDAMKQITIPQPII